ncbi:GNAT family N-acetyltransferase [Acidipropionibacterium virtanenii]|uniref:Aminoglycoside N(6')-acetyltransferase type 1 n=1 Tax=Acidipropionibacterium virtanenii TaxID=2057246 RepID=A0A344USE1_9ACTN|nr:GNAT family N-acetyltransferase [Acidipropionibacterium virtanenii]AXE38189.1 Aminoglycoside N(6')-acetyltransferase type 1 [Acidipropionibacterium virtanenii]
MTMRAAGPADLDRVMGVELESFGDWSKGRRTAWSPTAWQADLDAAAESRAVTGRLVLIEVDDDRALGVADFHHVAETCDLDRIMVLPAARGAGLAGDLLESGMRWAAGRGARRMILETHDENVAALRLYRSHGFTTISRRPGYYGPGRDALVMSAPLPAGEPASPEGPARTEENHV